MQFDLKKTLINIFYLNKGEERKRFGFLEQVQTRNKKLLLKPHLFRNSTLSCVLVLC